MTHVMGAEAPRAALVHFWGPQCPCTGVATPRARTLTHDYRSRGGRLIVAVPNADLVKAAGQEFPEAVDILVVDGFEPPSSPAAALLGHDGRLA